MKATVALLSLALVVSACGGPRPAELQGGVCQQVAAVGYQPYPWPDVLKSPRAALQAGTRPPSVEMMLPAEHNAFRERLARLYAGKVYAKEPVRILSVSAGGGWGAFSLGFLDGWGRNARDPRPSFDIVTGVSTGSMIAPVVFLDHPDAAPPTDLARLRALYRTLSDAQVVTKRSLLSLLSSTSLYDTAPLRRQVEAIVTPDLVARIAQERTARNRSLLVMAVNLDSGVPVPFDLTAIAADASQPADWRRQRIIDSIMASAAIPIGFPPVFIDRDMYVDGGARKHAFFISNVVAAIAGQPMGAPRGGLQRYRIGDAAPIDLSIVVSGDMKIMPACTGKQNLDIIRVVERTAAISTDQLLRDSVELLLLGVGQSPRNRARFIDASTLVNYPTAGGAPSPGGPCPVPIDSETIFDARLQTCLDEQGYLLGQRDRIPWQAEVRGHLVTRR